MPRIHSLSLPQLPHDRFLFNIDANVGLRSPNKPIDVQLVQFGYYCLARNPVSQVPFKDVAIKIKPGSTYKGDPDDPLTQTILADQRFRGGIQDGHVSAMRPGTDSYNSSERHGFILAFLNNNMRDIMKGMFPRIDKHADCPAELAAAVRDTFD